MRAFLVFMFVAPVITWAIFGPEASIGGCYVHGSSRIMITDRIVRVSGDSNSNGLKVVHKQYKSKGYLIRLNGKIALSDRGVPTLNSDSEPNVYFIAMRPFEKQYLYLEQNGVPMHFDYQAHCD